MNSSTGSTKGQDSGAPFQWPFQGDFIAGISSFLKSFSDAAHDGSSFFNGMLAHPSVPQPIVRWIAQISTRVLNHLLQQKPSAAAQLAMHAGQTFSVVLAVGKQQLMFVWAILPDGLLEPHLYAGDSSPEAANPNAPEAQHKIASNATIHLNMVDVFQGLPKRDAIKRKVRIEGDVELAQSVSIAVNQLEWDAEADLARVLGDAPAVWVMQSLQWTQAQLQQKWNSIRDALREYWVYETRVMPNPHDYEVWRADLATLRDDVARLEKRINVLESLRKAQSS